jgi:hypothetical protein
MSPLPVPDPAPPSALPGADEAVPLSDAERAVLDLAYGQVEVVVHSSRIVQITRSQKVRLGD